MTHAAHAACMCTKRGRLGHWHAIAPSATDWATGTPTVTATVTIAFPDALSCKLPATNSQF
eukprot:361801-Chlamydomonas_euryale.AAC.2